MTQPILELDRVGKEYRVGQESVLALSNVSLQVMPQERVVLIGESGSGKSTLLNLVTGMDRPTTGEIRFRGEPMHEWSPKQRADYRRRDLGVIFQAYHLLPTQTALENVEWPLLLAGRPPAERRDRALQALDDVGLSDRARHKPTELSGGQQQRVAIARALIHRPHLLVADEPTGNLDASTSEEVVELLYSLVEQQAMTFLLVTHDTRLQHRNGCRTISLADGHWAATANND